MPYVHTPDSRMAWPRAEPCSHAINSYNHSPALFAVGIDVEGLAIPSYALGLDLKPFGIPIAMAINRNRRPHGNDSFFQACPSGRGRRGQCEVPDFAIGPDFHRRVRARKAHTAFDRSRELEFLIGIPSPAVMSPCGRCGNRNRENKGVE